MDGIILKAWTHAEEFDARYPVLSNPDWIIAENKPSTRIRFDSDGASGNMEMQR
jgi:hypothetical protein